MGITEKEGGVLKLVHPGRYVEIHRKPITAAEVLKKNPRHSITRPDVFEYPWIVVKPESVLHLGKVFFIVPNHTIYTLLKAAQKQQRLRFPNNPTRGQNSPSPRMVVGMAIKHQSQHQRFKQSLPITSCIGTTFQEQGCAKTRIRNQKPPAGKSNGLAPPRLINQHQWLPITSCIGTTIQEQDRDKQTIRRAKVDSCTKLMTSRYKNTHLESKEKPEEDFTSVIRPSPPNEYHFISANIPAVVSYREEVNRLKSCLRKQDSIRKSLRFRVSFVLPGNDEEQQSAVNVTGNYSCSSSDSFVHFTNLLPT